MPRVKWQLQEAKNQLSEVVRKAQSEGPQVITLHGNDAAVVVSAKDYGRLSRPRGFSKLRMKHGAVMAIQ